MLNFVSPLSLVPFATQGEYNREKGLLVCRQDRRRARIPIHRGKAPLMQNRRDSANALTTNYNLRGLSKRDLKRVTDYLSDNLTADVSLDALAGVVCISPSHFCYLFKQSTGMSPHQYVIRQRVEKAKSLLLAGEMTIADVASSVGFSDQAHLTRHMRRILGATPKVIATAERSDNLPETKPAKPTAPHSL